MKTSLCAWSAVGLVLFVATAASAGEGIFSSARPDASTGRSPSSQRRSLMDAWSGDRPTINSSNMNHGASWNRSGAPAPPSESFLTRTKNLLMPWSRSEPTTLPPTGTRRVYKGSTPPSETSSSSGGGPFAWLFGSPEPTKVETVNDFLGQKRPGSDR